MKIHFYLRFHTEFGQNLYVGGNAGALKGNEQGSYLLMNYLDNDYWDLHIELADKEIPAHGFQYKYYLQNKEGDLIGEWGNDRLVQVNTKEVHEVQLLDTWNHAGEYENAFFTAPFENVLLHHDSKHHAKGHKHYSHVFKVKAPLLGKHEVLCVLGDGAGFNHWSESDPVIMEKEGPWWTCQLDLHENGFPSAYKYAVYDTKEKKLLRYEAGENNRLVYGNGGKHRINILHDGFAHLPNNTWKGAGVAIPVFSLRTKSSFGVGEFLDIKLLADWCKKAGLKLIQLLPVNDTTATNSWFDSYPYAAISAFALHPLYINLAELAGKKHAAKIKTLKSKQSELNALADLDYENVMRFKMVMLKELYAELGEETLSSEGYHHFYKDNKHWLEPYAAFCFFRDKYGTSRYEQWPEHRVYKQKDIAALFGDKSPVKKDILFYCFVQYHLHCQLKEAADYAHKKGVVLKGDIPIGIYRHGCDAWVAPELYNMEAQAGAPPDDFTLIGQNWEFPTYNWKRMHEDGFAWWRQRFEQMSNYFDAFRIDHILGFFRIWTIPAHAVQGILGHFVPCIPVHYVEFGENGIWFDEQRFCKPFINDQVIYEAFGHQAEQVKSDFLLPNQTGGYDLRPEYATQRQVESYFAAKEPSAENEQLKLGLYDLISNVILFIQEGSQAQEFHFRISMDKTSSFRYLIPHVQEKLKALYVNYFFRRQDEFWKKEAMHKLPHLKAVTNMLVCGEDLGMVPDCVPDVMRQLGILSLEIQRMPKDPLKEFFHPNDAPYMSVITPSTHDMSTVRAWWEENRERTQQFYNQVLGQWGNAPYFCEAWVNRAIVLQHLYSPAMWSIFLLQDLLGMSETLRRENPQEERINNPAVPKHYWRYRMHLFLEDLIQQDEFNSELKGYVHNSGR